MKLLRVVVIGSGTEIGKTWCTAALGADLRRRGIPVACVKLVESGVSDPSLSDVQKLRASSSIELPDRARYAFPDPVSPHLAARRAGVSIALGDLVTEVARVEAQLQAAQPPGAALPYAACIIETAGGVFSPLSPSATNFDLARALDPALWLLVLPDRLGVLHDATATLLAMTHQGRRPDACLLNPVGAPDASTGTNAEELAQLGIIKPLACLRPNQPESIGPAVDWLLQQAE